MNCSMPPRPIQAIYYPPGQELQDEFDKVLDRQRPEGLSSVAKLKTRLKQRGFLHMPEGENFRTRCSLACGDIPSLVFGPGKDDKLILICHRCKASNKTFAAIKNALNLETYDGFTGVQNRDEELVESPLLSALRRHRERYGEPDPKRLPPHIVQAVIDRFTAKSARYEQALHPDRLRQLANELGLIKALGRFVDRVTGPGPRILPARRLAWIPTQPKLLTQLPHVHLYDSVAMARIPWK